jgi:MraZ protein
MASKDPILTISIAAKLLNIHPRTIMLYEKSNLFSSQRTGTKTEWEKLAEKLASLPISQADSRAFARLMLAGAMDVEVDKQGRIILPEYLRQFARLSKEVVVAGLYNRLELWDSKAWAQYKGQTEAASGSIAERMAELGV